MHKFNKKLEFHYLIFDIELCFKIKKKKYENKRKSSGYTNGQSTLIHITWTKMEIVWTHSLHKVLIIYCKHIKCNI